MIFPWSLWNGQEIILIPTRNTLLMTHPTSCNHGSSVGRWSKSNKKHGDFSKISMCISWLKKPFEYYRYIPFFNPIVNQLSVLFRKIHGPAWLFFNLPIGCFFIYLLVVEWREPSTEHSPPASQKIESHLGIIITDTNMKRNWSYEKWIEHGGYKWLKPEQW